MRILVADDDVTARIVLVSALSKRGHDVVAVGDGAEAWAELHHSNAPRLVLLDWMMPMLDGPTLCQRLRAEQADRPPYVILVTSRGEKADVAQGLHAGADDYLKKPFDPLELEARVEVGRRTIALQDRLAGTIEELQEALAQVKTLRGIVPICASCKKVRDDHGYWNQVEAYVTSHTHALFSHGLCPECTPKFFPGIKIKSAGSG